ncbi:methyltransferase domain-containing protein [Clostridium sp. ZS2-4]|uniref:methyltransferase domain-containing protein n=1 Tax=Clostridium sp. ZS2-4 TaxID=2987703 RepID=UPI00227A6FF2|nr:methyltransferase domain-containing protein [Clostridium sp. ZS2-4]MCY6353971.1 methyltransferase domain-containing protein [Clostridium sp. ZS2-4]
MSTNENTILEKMASIKKSIQKLVEQGNLELAKEFIQQYEKVIKDDAEMCSIKAVVLMIEKKYDEAKFTLNYGLTIDYTNFDITYNLAYLHEIQGNYNLALNYYKAAYEKKTNPETFSFIRDIIKGIIEKNNLNVDANKFLKEKSRSNKLKVLILCSFYSIYTKEYIEKLYNYNNNISFDIFTVEGDEAVYRANLMENTYENIYSYKDYEELLNILCLPNYYDIVHIHYLTPFYGQFSKIIRNKSDRLIISIWGSDFYRTNAQQKEMQRSIINVADMITFDNSATMNNFIEYYGVQILGKTSLNLFGLTALEHIKRIEYTDVEKIKDKLKIPQESIVVTCGYNAYFAHNHLEIIKSLVKYKDEFPDRTYFIFPMTYGGDAQYIDTVENELQSSGLNYRVLRKFMNFDEIAKLTRSTDILVQVQITDTLSATMLEHMFNGNIIITGEWLPYEPLKKRGIFYKEVDSVNNVGMMLSEVIEKLPEIKMKCTNNKDIIWAMSAWENTLKGWNDVYIKDLKALFNHKSYWNNRYNVKFNSETSGSFGLGEIYNNYLYKSKLDVIKYLINNLFGDLKLKNILELGPGTGMFTDYFYNNKINSYLGIDISDIAANNLSRRFNNFNFKVGDISNTLDYPNDGKYDMIFAANVLLHLTDKDKFEKTIHNISNSLDKDGYFINIEPITLTNEKTNSLYHSIINIKDMKENLKNENLEIIEMLSPTFFMNYPFDYKILDNNEKDILDIFNNISKYFSTTSDSIEYKETICEILYYLDKLCLLKYNKCTCEKILIIRKKGNFSSKHNNFKVDDIWNADLIKEKIRSMQSFITNNIKNYNLEYALDMIYEKFL